MDRLRPSAQDPLLIASQLRVRFGGITALDGVSFEIRPGEICGLIGPNGAGKTTLLNCLSRLYDCEGSITFSGEPLLSRPAHAIASLGIARTFQNLAVFESLTVMQTVMLGCHTRMRAGYLASLLGHSSARKDLALAKEEAERILAFCGLESSRDGFVNNLPFGTRKRVELARALAARPKLLLLDEPAGGLNHQEVDDLARLVIAARQMFGTAVLLVEHHMGMVMQVCERIIVLDFGRKLTEGTPAQVTAHPEVISAYLGSPA